MASSSPPITIFTPDHGAVARELARVCRLGGRLGLAAWRLNPDYSAVLEPFRPPPEPGGDPNDWGREDHVLELLDDAFELEFVEGESAIRGESGEAIWQFLRTCHGPFKALVEALAPDRREELHRSYIAYLERHRTDGGIRPPDPYLLILGQRR